MENNLVLHKTRHTRANSATVVCETAIGSSIAELFNRGSVKHLQGTVSNESSARTSTSLVLLGKTSRFLFYFSKICCKTQQLLCTYTMLSNHLDIAFRLISNTMILFKFLLPLKNPPKKVDLD